MSSGHSLCSSCAALLRQERIEGKKRPFTVLTRMAGKSRMAQTLQGEASASGMSERPTPSVQFHGTGQYQMFQDGRVGALTEHQDQFISPPLWRLRSSSEAKVGTAGKGVNRLVDQFHNVKLDPESTSERAVPEVPLDSKDSLQVEAAALESDASFCFHQNAPWSTR